MKLVPKTLLPCLVLGLAALPSLATTAASPATLAQEQATAPPELTTARAVIDRYLDVSGINTVYKDVKSVRALGELELVGMGLKGRIDVRQARPNKMAIKVSFEGFGESLSGYDGKVGWRLDPMMGETILEGVALEQLRTRSADFDQALHDPKQYEKIEFLGKVQFEGKECYKITFLEKPYPGLKDEETKPYRTYTEYYSVADGLIAGSDSMTEGPTGPMEVKGVVKEYRKFGGLLYPAVSIEKMGPQTLKVTVDLVEFDTAKEGTFDLPPAIKVLAEDLEKEGEGDGK